MLISSCHQQGLAVTSPSSFNIHVYLKHHVRIVHNYAHVPHMILKSHINTLIIWDTCTMNISHSVWLANEQLGHKIYSAASVSLTTYSTCTSIYMCMQPSKQRPDINLYHNVLSPPMAYGTWLNGGLVNYHIWRRGILLKWLPKSSLPMSSLASVFNAITIH